MNIDSVRKKLNVAVRPGDRKSAVIRTLNARGILFHAGQPSDYRDADQTFNGTVIGGKWEGYDAPLVRTDFGFLLYFDRNDRFVRSDVWEMYTGL